MAQLWKKPTCYHHGARGNMILPVSVNHIEDSCLLILTKTSMTAFGARFYTISRCPRCC